MGLTSVDAWDDTRGGVVSPILILCDIQGINGCAVGDVVVLLIEV